MAKKKKVTVITGGGSGMGLEAAKFLDPAKLIVISGRTVSKLEKAQKELEKLGFKVYPHSCDTSDRKSVKDLVKFAGKLGEVTQVLNCAGVSPTMATPETIMKINALGTVHVNQEFSKVMPKGSVIVDIASCSAYQVPEFALPKKFYPLADKNEKEFLRKMLKRTRLMPDDYLKAGMAYAFSKHFVIWYAKKSAFLYGPKGIRVCSVSPGLIDTTMGKAEADKSGELFSKTCENRMGKPEELGFAIATIADERNGYLAGVDVLVDGGAIAGAKEFKKKD